MPLVGVRGKSSDRGGGLKNVTRTGDAFYDGRAECDVDSWDLSD